MDRFLIRGSTATAPEVPLLRVSAAEAPSLRGVERLIVPAGVRELYGLNRFENLRVLEYAGAGDLLGFGETLDWLAEKLDDEEGFLYRLATNILSGRPISPALTAILAPHMPALTSFSSYPRLLDCLDDAAKHHNTRQDSARENIFLCVSYAQLRRLEYAQTLGSALCGSGGLSPAGQVVYALAHLQGHSYQAFYAAGGAGGYPHMKTWDAYLPYLRRGLDLRDTDALRRQLLALLDLGLLTRGNWRSALDLLTQARAAGAAAFLLDHCGRLWPAGDAPLSFLDDEFQL